MYYLSINAYHLHLYPYPQYPLRFVPVSEFVLVFEFVLVSEMQDWQQQQQL